MRVAKPAVSSVKPTAVPATSGRPLDRETRAHVEPRLGYDLSHVRVYADDEAARSAARMGAGAYTVGSHIVFGRDAYRPGDVEGRRLLFHELAHSAQQRSARDSTTAARAAGGASSPLERQADSIAERLVNGHVVSPGMISSAPQAIQCAPPPKPKNLTEPQVLASLDEALEDLGLPYNTEVAGTLTVHLADGTDVVAEVRLDRVYQGRRLTIVEGKGTNPNAFTQGQSILTLAQQNRSTFVVRSAAGSPPTSGKVADLPLKPGDVIQLEPGDTHVVHGNRTGSKLPDPGGPVSMDSDAMVEGLRSSYPAVEQGDSARFTTRGEMVGYIPQGDVEAFQRKRGVQPRKPKPQAPTQLPKKPPTRLRFDVGGEEEERPRSRIATPRQRVRIAPQPPQQPTQEDIDRKAELEQLAEQEYADDLDASPTKRRMTAQTEGTTSEARAKPAPRRTTPRTTMPARQPEVKTSTPAASTTDAGMEPPAKVSTPTPSDVSATPDAASAPDTAVTPADPVGSAPTVDPVTPTDVTVPEQRLGTAFEGAKGIAGDLAGFVAENVAIAAVLTVYAAGVGWVQQQHESGKIEGDLAGYRPAIAQRLQDLAPDIAELRKHGKVYSHITFDIQYAHDFIPSTQNYDDYYKQTVLGPVVVDAEDIGSIRTTADEELGDDQVSTIKHNRVTVSKLLFDPDQERRDAETARIKKAWAERAAKSGPAKADPHPPPISMPPTIAPLIREPAKTLAPSPTLSPAQAMFAAPGADRSPQQIAQDDAEWWLSRVPLAKQLAAQWCEDGEMISSDAERLAFLRHEARWREEATVVLDHFLKEGPAGAAEQMKSVMNDSANGGARLRDLRRANGGAD